MMIPMSQSARIGGVMQVDVARDAAARLAEQQAAQLVVVALHERHPFEHRGPGRRQHAADDDVAHLALGMAADDGNHPLCAHRFAPLFRGAAAGAYAKRCGRNGARSSGGARPATMSATSRAVAAACVSPRWPWPNA